MPIRLMILLLFIPLSSHAQFVGIGKSKFESHYRAQYDLFWSWATSVEMVLSYQGMDLEKDAIVDKAKEAGVNESIKIVEMLSAINTVMQDKSGQSVQVLSQYTAGPPSPIFLYNQLVESKPVILMVQSSRTPDRAVVVTGMEANVSDQGVVVSSLYVFDPYSYETVMTANGWLPNQDKNLEYLEYSLINGQIGLRLGDAGYITGVIMVDGTKM